jgi:hypothetical protein
MSRLSGFRGFGRTASTPAPSKEVAGKGVADGGDLGTVGFFPLFVRLSAVAVY